MSFSKPIREQEKTNKPPRCLKCNDLLETNEEKDILVCAGCSKRKGIKKTRHS